MLDFLIGIIFVIFGVRVGQQKILILLIIPFGGKYWIHTRRAHEIRYLRLITKINRVDKKWTQKNPLFI
jgi:hypothetical protein